ncbi:Protein sds23 [Steccherinum ochraceum]|uniref:Protein sds23 n=1 Tax=Steccherinum ochraceum TaxID=92696 RepID=A0A4R0RJL5_9APHY|nr:Protein sds23 [Steccherinum ochraceum]
MSLGKRLSVSSIRSESPLAFAAAPNADAEEWTKAWSQTLARELIDCPVVSVDADTTVEEACELLLSKDILCLTVTRNSSESSIELFDFSDVNAFLTLAATQHRFTPEDLLGNPRIHQIVTAAKAGRVPVHIVSNLSEKNPLETLPHDATVISLLSVFARGPHRALIRAPPPSSDYLGFVSDRSLLSWFTSRANQTASLHAFLTNSLSSLNLPSLYLYTSVVAASAAQSVLDAMKLMSDEGVSSVAVVEEENGALLSAVSVRDIGRVVIPSQSKQILSTPLKQFVSLIKAPDGLTDGIDKSPIYSVLPSSTLLYTMQKLIATNAHRVFVTDEPQTHSPMLSPSPSAGLCGIVSVVDILSLFARIANITDIDPSRMQRHRRASSASSHSSSSAPGGRSPDQHQGFPRSRSSSRTGYSRLSPRNSLRNSVSSLDTFQWAERVPKA